MQCGAGGTMNREGFSSDPKSRPFIFVAIGRRFERRFEG